jgi:hypothetical protein
LPGLKLVSASTIAPPSNTQSKFKSVTANCPSGTVAIGTGAQVDYADRGVTITQVSPYGSDFVYERGVTVSSAWDRSDVTTVPDNYRLVAWAVCANRPSGYQLVSQTSPDTTSNVLGRFILCPQGKRALGATAPFLRDDTLLSHLVELSLSTITASHTTTPPGTTTANLRFSRRVSSPKPWNFDVGAICAN